LIRLQPDRRWHPLCHHCHAPAHTIHSQGHRRTIRDLNLADRQIWLELTYRKIWCAQCGKARVEYLSFCDSPQRLTHRLRRYIYELCKMLSVAEVARHLELDAKTVAQVDREFLQEEFNQTDYAGLRVLAIDEIAVKKGQQYMTVVLDYDTGRVVWTGEGHDKDTLDRFFGGMSLPQKAALQAVAIDMHDPYINRLQYHCPQALIVFDFFHVVAAFSRVIDEVRREQVRRATGTDKQVIKGSRYLLLKNRDHLREDQQDRLDELLRINQRLNAVYVLKDQLKMIYQYASRRAAEAALEEWCRMASQIDNWWMQQFIKRLRHYAYGIVNHCAFPIGTSRIEGVNNRIKLIKRRAYGYHDPEYFGLKIKQAFPGKLDEASNFFG
jgi:transposase